MRKSLAILVCVLITSAFGSFAFAAPVTIVVGNPAGWTETMPFKAAIGNFEKQTGIHVEFRDLGFDVIESKEILAATGASGEFDVFALAWLTEPRMTSYQVALDPYIAKDFGSVDKWKNMFFPRIVQDFGDQVKNVTFHINSQFGLYRKGLFDNSTEKAAFKAKFGYDLAAPKTLKQLVDIAQFFTRGSYGPEKTKLWGFLPVVGPGNVEWVFADWCYLYGVEFFKEDGTVPFKSGQDNANTLVVARAFADLAKAMPPDVGTTSFAEDAAAWKDGKAAMSYGYWGDYWRSFADPKIKGKIGETASFYLDTTPNGHNFGGYWSYSISKDSKHVDAAWQYLKWVVSKEMALKVADFAGLSPSVAEYGKQAASMGYVAPALVKGLERLKGAPRIPEMNTIFAGFEPPLSDLLTGAVGPEQAVADMADSTGQILQKAGYGQ